MTKCRIEVSNIESGKFFNHLSSKIKNTCMLVQSQIVFLFFLCIYNACSKTNYYTANTFLSLWITKYLKSWSGEKFKQKNKLPKAVQTVNTLLFCLFRSEPNRFKDTEFWNNMHYVGVQNCVYCVHSTYDFIKTHL